MHNLQKYFETKSTVLLLKGNIIAFFFNAKSITLLGYAALFWAYNFIASINITKSSSQIIKL